MAFRTTIFLCLTAIGLAPLGGCEAPHGGHYNNATYDAPFYDADIYVPKYTAEQPVYDHNYYHEDIYGDRL